MCEKPLYVHRQSAYLFGRDRKVADVPTDHPSCSSQHAVLQYRLVELPQEPGFMGPPKRTVKPYIMDLGGSSQVAEAGRADFSFHALWAAATVDEREMFQPQLLLRLCWRRQLCHVPVLGRIVR
jgi:hypothetical protein